MRRLLLFMLLASVMPRFTFGQMSASDSQNLQALLTEVRELRQDLRQSLGRLQNAQILLTRLNLQQESVSHALQRVDEARAKFIDRQAQQKDLENHIKNLEEVVNEDTNPDNQKRLREELNTMKGNLEAVTGNLKQLETARIDAEQQLQAEQDKLSAIEAELDELIRNPPPSR